MFPKVHALLLRACGLLMLFLRISALSQNVSVFHSVQPLPSPYISDWELNPNLTFMQINASDPLGFLIVAEVIVTEQSYGEVLRGSSVPIEVSAGNWSLRINNTEFVNWDNVKYSEAVEEIVNRTGRIPDGSYTICSNVRSYPDENLLAEDCAGFTVLQPLPPVLIYPSGGSVVENIYPVFQWTPVQWFGHITYQVTLAEIFEGTQQPTEAVEVNIPYLQTEVMNQTRLVYGLTFPAMEPGKHYAWRVQALDMLGNPIGQNSGSSEVEHFYFGMNPSQPFIYALAPGNDCSGSVNTMINTTAASFTWQAGGSFSEYFVCVTDNPCGKYPPGDPTTPGGGKPTTTGGPTAGAVPRTTLQPVTSGVQSAAGELQPTGQMTISVNDAVSGLRNDVLPDAVAQSFENLNPALGRMLYVSPPIPSGSRQGDDFSQPQFSQTTHSIILNLDGVVQPGAAFTYFICGIETQTNIVVYSQTKCERYSPVTTSGEVPITVPCPKNPTCQIEIKTDVEPKMDGGLTAFSKTLTEINRDDFIPLEAEGLDFDKVIWTCTPADNCPEDGSERKAPLTGRVKFVWEIIEGEGYFKKLGCLPDLKSDEGEHVIFQPPFVELPKDDKTPNKKITKIKLQIIDDNSTQPVDPTVERLVTIETTRKKSAPNKYFLKITSDAYTLPKAPPKEDKIGKCKALDPVWTKNDDFTNPSIELPPVADNDKMVVGEMMILKVADQRDTDEFNVQCESKTCTSTRDKKLFEDDVEYNWKILSGSGKILGKAKGRTIIYQAVMSMQETKDKELITIECEAVNPYGLQIADKPKKGKITFYVHNAGVKVSHPDVKWLPKDDNDVELTSSLKYKDGSLWKDALAHQCRIHFLELLNVSKEPGICLNEPVKSKADKCVDLHLKDEGEQEAFSAASTGSSCSTKDLLQEARTKKPVKEYTIKIYSRDFGSYGFLRSYANINTNPADGQVSGSPLYYSIPVKKSDVTHPGGRAKKKEYKDNRVTIPLDIDENCICDGGWHATVGGKHIPDPADNLEDKDDKPKGDGDNGDGYSNYEEYRGFKVTLPAVNHVRLDNTKKDLFINNEDNLPVGNFETQSELVVHLIDEAHYNKNSERYVNFNFATAHKGDQRGLHLVDAGTGTDGLLGIAVGAGNKPNPPNWEIVINVYVKSITAYCRSKKLDNDSKLAQVTAHELAHGCNVWHHGESPENNKNNAPGVRSGDLSCIMRYDNVGNAKEAIGGVFCTGTNGTGANNNPKPPAGFGPADTSRGNCKGQFRVNHNTPYPDRTLKK